MGKMKIFAAILLAVACVHANSSLRYGWAPGTESIFRFESQILTGIPDIQNSKYAGLKLAAQVRVQASPDYTLRVKLEQTRFITVNGEISLTEARRIIGDGGSNAGAKEALPQEFRTYLEEPFMVHLKRGLVESFSVSQDEPVAVTNIKRSVLSQFQLDVSGSQRYKTETNRLDVAQGAQLKAEIPYYLVHEESLHGKCQTLYNIYPMTPARVLELEQKWRQEEEKAQLPPSVEGKAVCEGKKYFEIVKTRNLDHCHFSPAYQQISGAEGTMDVTKSHAGSLLAAHIVSSTTYVCGNHLSSFDIRKVVVDDVVVTNPMGYNTEQKQQTATRIMMELLKKESISAKLPDPAQAREETSLVYAYPEQAAMKNQMSNEVIQKTQQIVGTVPILPQPELTEARKSLIPVQLPKPEIITKVVEQLKRIARKIFESPESCSSKLDISGQLVSVSKYMKALSLNDLEEVWTKALADVESVSSGYGDGRQVVTNLLADAIAMVGTNPATMLVIKKIEARDVSPIKASVVIQSAIKNIRTPTKELLREFIKLIRQWKNVNVEEKRQVLTSTLFQLSNLFYRAYVNPSTMVSNYPVRIYGIFGTKDSRVLVDEYIPLLKEMLREVKQSPDKHMELVVITALGKLGHRDAVKPIIEVAQGPYEPMVRSLAVYELKRMTKRYPTEMKAVLLAIINNPVEHPDVRMAAIAILPWSQPSYAQLQEIAFRSWYDPSEQVSSFARSTFESLLYTDVPELKPLGVKVNGIMHVFKPTHYGLQYSKNIHVSKFVRYLMSSVSSKFVLANSKYGLAPSKIALATELYLDALGDGMKVKSTSFSLLSQGVDRIIDYTLKIASDMTEMKSHITEELVKIAKEINLKTRIPPKFMAYVHQSWMGYEAAAFLTHDTMLNMIESIGKAMDNDKLKRGLEYQYAGAANLISVEAIGNTEAGFPVFGVADVPVTSAFSASVKYDPNSQWMFKASITPVWNMKVQSNLGIISTMTEEVVATGVTTSIHSSAPLESLVSVKKGELDIILKPSEASQNRGKGLETIHGYIMPFIARKSFRSVEPLNKVHDIKPILSGVPLKKVRKHFHGIIDAEFSSESDNEFVDIYSYWEKIQQNDVHSLLTVAPLMSSIRMSSARFVINPSMSDLKEVSLKIRLYARKPNKMIEAIFKPIDQAIEHEIESKGFTTLKKTLSLLSGEPATIVKLEASLKESSAAKKFEAFVAVGAKPRHGHVVHSTAAASVKLPRGKVYSIVYEGEFKMPKINARWTKEQVLQQPLELSYNAEVRYGADADPNSQKKIILVSKLEKTQAQVKAVRESEEFKKCAMEANAGRRLSPICIKVRQQAGSLDHAEVTLTFPGEVYTSPIFATIEQLIKAKFVTHYKLVTPAPQLPARVIKLEFDIARAGDVAQVKVEHKQGAYKLENIRIPYSLKGVLPACARNPVYDWIEQRATNNLAPASCRLEPEIVTTFDNKTYSYQINDCEHVLLLDGSRTYPIGVLASTISGQKKKVTILSGESKIEITPVSSSLQVKLDGRMETINSGQTFYEKSTKTGNVIVEIRHYKDGVYYVYAPNQRLHVLTDGISIEVIAPQLLRNRAVGLCGDLNGEFVADLKTPRECIMKPKLAAMSYMLNKGGSSSDARCSGIPSADLSEYRREEQSCVQERIIRTPILPIFERAESLNKPVVSAHLVRKQEGLLCISKEKLKYCSGQSEMSSPGMTSSKPNGMKMKLVEYGCVSSPSSKAQSLENRAKGGESLSVELSAIPTHFSKMEAEAITCSAAKATGGFHGGIGGANEMGSVMGGGEMTGGGSSGWKISLSGGHGISESGSGMGGGSGTSGSGNQGATYKHGSW